MYFGAEALHSDLSRQTCAMVFEDLIFLLQENEWVTDESKQLTKPAITTACLAKVTEFKSFVSQLGC